MSRVLLALFAFGCLFFCHCHSEPAGVTGAQQHLQDIISQHFSDMPVAKDLIPVADADRWIGQRMQVVHDDRGNVFTVPPPPPADTILYDAEFTTFTRKAKMSRSDLEDFRAQLRLAGTLHQLLVENGIDVPDHRPSIRSHYQVSVPLFNHDYSKALITVHNFIPGSFRGYQYLFKRKKETWVLVFSHLYSIE